MKETKNSILIGLLLSFTMLFTLCSLTLLNKNYYRHELDYRHYYEDVQKNIKEEFEYCGYKDINVDIKDIRDNMNYYIGNNFEKVEFHKYDNEVLNEIYNRNIKFKDFFNDNYNKIKIIIIVIMIALIVVTFEVYLNLNCERYNFLFISGFFGLILNFIVYKSFYFDNNIIDYLFDRYMLYYLIANIFQMVYSVYLYFVLNTKNVKKK